MSVFVPYQRTIFPSCMSAPSFGITTSVATPPLPVQRPSSRFAPAMIRSTFGIASFSRFLA